MITSEGFLTESSHTEQAIYFLKISLEAVKKFNIDTTQIHHDTTSVSVWGAYENSRYDGSPFEITFGNSKDKRPDLAQFVVSLLCAEKDLPIETRIYSGNEDDKTISKGILKRIFSLYGRLRHRRRAIYLYR